MSNVGKIRAATGDYYHIIPKIEETSAFEVRCYSHLKALELSVMTESIWEAVHLGELFLEQKEKRETTTSRTVEV